MHSPGRERLADMRLNRTIRTRPMALLPALGLLWCAAAARAQPTPQHEDLSLPQLSDKRLVSDADFKIILHQIEAVLPIWDSQLNSIDLEKVPEISYARGKSIVEQRDLGLMEIGNIRTYAAKLQAKRTVSGELELWEFLQSLSDIGGEIVWQETVNCLTLSSIEKYEPQLNELSMRTGNDVLARVALLEKGRCP
jgi:hypothetical protein